MSSDSDKLIADVGAARVFNPDGLSVVVDMAILYEKDALLAKRILGNARQFYALEKEVRNRIISYTQTSNRYRLRLVNLLDIVSISQLFQQSFENRIVQFRGIVVQVLPVRKLTSHRVYQCKRCRNMIEYDADTVEGMQGMPKSKMLMKFCRRCKEREEAANREYRGASPYDLMVDRCVFVPMQKITIQERIEEMGSGRAPSKISAYLLDDLACDMARCGDKITAVGAIFPDLKTKSFNLYAELLSLTRDKTAFEDVKWTATDIERFNAIGDDPKVYEKLIASFDPAIYGNRDEKLALLCSLFGSPRIDRDGTTKRGDIHVLLIGDPALAKSDMISWAARVAPRGMHAMGGRTTGPGLTASWLRGEDGSSEIQPGAMVVLDEGGLLAMDEADKMNAADRQAIHTPMEQQKLTVVMAGAIMEFYTRCTIIAAANPKKMRYNPNLTLLDNVTLDEAFLSRFDVIYVMRDLPNEDADERVATHMLGVHSNMGRMAPIDIETLTKYIAYAKTDNPELKYDGEAFKIIHDGYLNLRRKQGAESIFVTPRQLDGLVRISKALARMQLATNVNAMHAKMALYLYSKSAKPISMEIEDEDKPKTNIATFMSSTEERIWDQIAREGVRGSIFTKKIINMNPGKEDIVDKVFTAAIADGRLVKIDDMHVKVVSK